MMAAAHSTGMGIVQVLIIILFVVAAIVATIKQGRAARQRSLDLQTLAARLGFDDFNSNRDEGFAMGWGFLSRLAQGNDRYAFNILRGTYHEQSLFVFDYHYQTGSGKSRKEHYSTLLMLVFKEIFPQVAIGPESLRAKIAGGFRCRERHPIRVRRIFADILRAIAGQKVRLRCLPSANDGIPDGQPRIWKSKSKAR